MIVTAARSVKNLPMNFRPQQFQYLQSTGAEVVRESVLIVSIAGVPWKEQPSRRRLY